MPDHLFQFDLFNDETINGTGSATTPALDLRWIDRVEALLIKAESDSGAADVKVEYAISKSKADADFGSFDDEVDILESSNTDFTTNPEGWHTVSMPNPLAPFIKIKVTGVGTNPSDTKVTARLLCREAV